MSAQGVKKRLGSRRQVKSKSPEVDEFTITETTVEQHSLSTESAEDVPEVLNNRRKLGSSRKNKRPHPGNALGVLNEATKNATEDDPLDTSQVVKVAHQVPEESHKLSELNKQRHEKDKISATLTHNESLQDNCWVFESHLISEDAEPSTEMQPDKEIKENLSQSGGAVQTSDLTKVCDSELNTEPVEAEESQGIGGLEEVPEPLSQSSHEHREAEPSSAGTEEPPEETHWLVETGTVEKESELMCEKEIVMSEPPESFRSGSPPEVQNLHTSHPEPDPEPEKESELMCEKEIVMSEIPESFRSGSPPEVQNLHTIHPEPDPEPSIPKSANLPEDLHEQGADSKVELSDDDDEEATTLMQQMNEMSLNENEHSGKTQSEAGSILDGDLQEDVELIPASTAMMTTADIIIPKDIQDHQPAQKMNPVVSEEKSLQEDRYLSQNIKDDNTTAMTGSQSNLWRTTDHNRSATPEDPHVVQKDQGLLQRNDAKETVEDPGAEGSFEDQQKLAESSDTLTQEEAQEISSSSEPTHSALTSSEPPLPLPDPAMEGLGECDPGDDRLDFQERPERRRRKMGSSRRTRKNPEDEQVCRAEPTESSNSIQAGGGGFERPAEVSWEENTETSVKLLQDVANVSSSPQSTHSNLISHTDFAGAAGRSASDSQSLYPTVIVEGADLWDGGRNTDLSLEPSHLDEFTAPEAHITSCLIKPSQCSPPPSFQSTGDDHESLLCLTGKQEQPLQSAEESTVDLETVKSQLDADGEQKDLQDPDKVAEGGYIKNLDPANTGSNLSMASRGGAMGSTCRNISSHRKEEDLHHQQRVGNETADKLRGDGSPDPREGPAKGTHLPESAALQTSEEAPTASESDRQSTTSPENDVMSYTLSSGRRRKLGSHRKASRPQSQGTKPGSDIGSIAEEHTVKRNEDAKMSEVDDSEKNSTNTSPSEAGGHVNPVSANSDLSFAPSTLVRFQPLLESCSSQENQSLSLGSSGAEDVKSNSYNVIMVGNSNVGKTSFMKRVLNGRFSSDLPSSVGLDMCMWPVTVDGKRVMLQLWDTAGQERFHSITRQIFHKAHAFLLMYDITSSRSFTAVSYWANCIQEGATETVTVFLLGNKSDCAGRQVPTQEGEILAKEYAFGFMECSAATGQNVNESLETVARILSNKVKLREETTMLQKEPRQKKSSGCC